MKTGPLKFWLIALSLWLALAANHGAAADPAGAPLHAGADYYVATRGDDMNPGTATAPFRTLARARDAVRKQIAAGLTKDLLVQIAGGRYEQAETLSFGPRDSGTATFSITYAAAPNESVQLSGGRQITGWRRGNGNIWTTELPAVKTGKWYFRQLFVDGVRAVRARTPNTDSKEPWCKMLSSTAKYEDEEKPVTVKLGGYEQPFKIVDYRNPEDMELVYICNNDGGRKRIAKVDEEAQSITLATPNRWNSKAHANDWFISFPNPNWKACYLENALEMLDEPGEWYLDRKTGVLSYWPRPDEDLASAAVFAPVVPKTLLEVVGTRDQPVLNLHFNGLYVEHTDLPPPDYGYMGLACCVVDSGPKDKPEYGFIEAAIEFKYGRSCSFTDGGVSHVGGMGICLRRGTATIAIEGNEISDLGGGGIGTSEIRQPPVGQRSWNPFPRPDDYQGYRIANNDIHDCGTDYYGAAGITLLMAHDSVVVHNLIHDTAYSGIQWGGDGDERSLGFTRDNTVAYNHVYRAMKTTVDGGGLYVTCAHAGHTVIRGNLIHDILCNPFHRGASEAEPGDSPCHGLYLDGNMSGGRFEGNVVFRNAGGPLLFNTTKDKNTWGDNLFQKDGAPPNEFIEAMQAVAGLEPAYQKRLLGTEANPCAVYPSLDGAAGDTNVRQFDLPAKHRGIVEIVGRANESTEHPPLKLKGLEPGGRYALKVYHAVLAPAAKDFYASYTNEESIWAPYANALGDLPILSDVGCIPASKIGLKSTGPDQTASGEELTSGALHVDLSDSPEVIWIAYHIIR